MNEQEKVIALKYLRIAQSETRKIWDEYYELVKLTTSQKEAYQLVEKYHKKTRKILEKINKQGWAEINRQIGD